MSDLIIKEDDFRPRIQMHYREAACYDVAEHTHDFLMVYYVISGHTGVYLEGKEYPAKAGDIVVINPGKRHNHLKSDAVILFLGYSDFQIEGMEKDHLSVPHPVITPVRYTRELYQCYRTLVETQEKKDACWGIMSNAIAAEFLIWLLKELSPSKSTDIKEFFQLKMYDKESIVNMMTAYLKENYMKKISVEEIARYTYLSTTYVTKIFKEIINDTPINYLITIRLEKAKELLKEGQLSVQEIAKQIGYDDPYYFSKLFKKKYGVSPSEYRKQE